MITDDNITIKEARDKMRPLLSKGTKCPCCSLTVRMYSRTITSSMAYGLILIYHEFKKTEMLREVRYLHIEDFFKSISDLPASVRADIPKLRFWGLIVGEQADKLDGNPSTGMYKITQIGNSFVEGTINVPKHVKIYNNQFYGYEKSTGEISIRQALKNKFDYNKLLNGEL